MSGIRGRGIVAFRGHAIGLQGIHLVLHLGDQRGDHEAHPGALQRGDLVAERLAAAGWHQHEGIPAGDQFLSAPASDGPYVSLPGRVHSLFSQAHPLPWGMTRKSIKNSILGNYPHRGTGTGRHMELVSGTTSEG